MKRNYFNTFEESDFRICEDMEFNSENKNIFIPMEAWFDVDKKFGINIIGDDSAWVNLFAEYNPVIGEIRMFYDIDTENKAFEREYVMTDEERSAMTQYIEKMCMQRHHVPCMEFYITEYIETCDCEIDLECRQEGNVCRVYNTNDGAILYQEDMGGNLSKHIGHKIELANYGDSECYSIECMDCNEVLFSSDVERIRLQDIEDNDGQEMHM